MQRIGRRSFSVAEAGCFASFRALVEAIMDSVLEKPVLVLNRFWQPVHTCSVRRSLHLLCIGHAQVVQVEGEQRFNTHDLPHGSATRPLSTVRR